MKKMILLIAMVFSLSSLATCPDLKEGTYSNGSNVEVVFELYKGTLMASYTIDGMQGSFFDLSFDNKSCKLTASWTYFDEYLGAEVDGGIQDTELEFAEDLSSFNGFWAGYFFISAELQ